MDFSFSEEQDMLRDLAREILEKELPPERLKEVEASDSCVDEALWAKLAEANLLGVGVPEAQGGMGFGILELCVLLEELGRAVAPVPALSSLVLGGLSIARFGNDAQRDAWLRPLAAGEVLLTAALEDAASGDPAAPATKARREGSRSGDSRSADSDWVLDGRKRLVSGAQRASRILVPAATDAGVGVFLLDPSAAGVSLTASRTSTREPLFDLTLDGARCPADALLGNDARNGAEAARWMHTAALVATCAMQLGVVERALELTMDYLREREQFGVPIGTFPAVQQRAADRYIDVGAIRWTAWRAAWKLSVDQPAEREAGVAKFWAADGGARVVDAAMHMHGGIGVDLDFPIHRYFTWSKSLELSLGGATPQLVRLGRDMARSGPQELG